MFWSLCSGSCQCRNLHQLSFDDEHNDLLCGLTMEDAIATPPTGKTWRDDTENTQGYILTSCRLKRENLS